jgi:phospholipid-transporting ATPase
MDDIYHIVQVAFGFSIILFWGDLKQSTGYDSGHWFWGTMLYLAVLLTVLGKAALVSECVHGHRATATIAHALHIVVFGRSIPLQVTTFTPERDAEMLISHVLLAIPGSFVFTMLFLPLYIAIAPSIGVSLEYQGLDPRLFTDSVFWFTILLVPAICLSRDFVWK